MMRNLRRPATLKHECAHGVPRPKCPLCAVAPGDAVAPPRSTRTPGWRDRGPLVLRQLARPDAK